MAHPFTKPYVSTGVRNAEDGPPFTPIEKVAMLQPIIDALYDAAETDGSAGTPTRRTLGSSAAQATAGNDRRLAVTKGVDSAKAALVATTSWYFSTDLDGGTLFWSNGSAWFQVAQGLASVASGTTIVGVADGQTIVFDGVTSNFIAGLISDAGVSPTADIDPTKILGTAVTYDDPAATDARQDKIRFLANGGIQSSEPFDRSDIDTWCTIAAGREVLVGIPVEKGVPIAKIALLMDGSGASGITHSWVTLRDNNMQKLFTSADKLTHSPVIGTPEVYTLTTPVTPSADDYYYVSVLFVATTPPVVAGRTATDQHFTLPIATGQERIAAISTATGLTTPPTNITPDPGGRAQILYVATLPS